jgi:bacteriorhodopsin
MPTPLVLLSLLLALGCSGASNFSATNVTNSSYTQFLSCCSNTTQPVVACLAADFNTSAHYALNSTFSSVARAEVGVCSTQQQVPAAKNGTACTPPRHSLECLNSTLMSDVCVLSNQSFGSQWTCSDRPVLEFFNLSKCIEAFQQNNISSQGNPVGAEKSLSDFFANSFSVVAGLEQSGSNALNISWISFLVAGIALAFCSRGRVCDLKAERRVLRVLIAVNIFAMIAYLVMSAGEGRVKIYRVQINQQSTTFSMFVEPEPMQHQWYSTPTLQSSVVITLYFPPRYARHLLWIITTPGLLYALWFMGGAPVEYFVLAIAMAEIMLVCGLLATLLAESPAARWLLLIYGIFFFCIIIYLLIRRFITEEFRGSQLKKTKEHMRSAFTLAANYTVIVWLMYPIFWILADGLNQLDDNSSVIAFSVLDMASKIGFSAIFFRACKKSPNWLKSMFVFSRSKPSQLPAPALVSQQQHVSAPAAVATENPSAAAVDAAVDFQSPTVHIRKTKARYGSACASARVTSPLTRGALHKQVDHN